MTKRILTVLLFALIGWAQPAFAKLEIEIIKGNAAALPIAVVPFQWRATGYPDGFAPHTDHPMAPWFGCAVVVVLFVDRTRIVRTDSYGPQNQKNGAARKTRAHTVTMRGLP